MFKFLGIAVILVTSLIIAVLCWAVYWSSFGSIYSIEGQTSLTFPKSAKVTGAYFQGGLQERTHYARIECISSEIPEFIHALPKHSIATTKYRGMIENNIPVKGWNPAGVEKFVWVESRPSKTSGYICMLIDLGRHDKAIIYFSDTR